MDRVILYHALLPGPPLTGALPSWASDLAYTRRSRLPSDPADRTRSLLGLGLALRGLSQLLARSVAPPEIVFQTDRKPRVAGIDFSIAHAGQHVAVALRRQGRIGLDLEDEDDPQQPALREGLPAWIAREAVVKAVGFGLRELARVALGGDGATLDGLHFHLRELRIEPGCRLCIASDAVLSGVELREVASADVTALLCAA